MNGRRRRERIKIGFTLSSSSFNSNLSLSRSSWTWRAFKARHTSLSQSEKGKRNGFLSDEENVTNLNDS